MIEATSQHSHRGQAHPASRSAAGFLGAVNESRQHLACATHSFSTPFTVACIFFLQTNLWGEEEELAAVPRASDTDGGSCRPHYHRPVSINQSKVLTRPHTGREKPRPSTATEGKQTPRHEVPQAWGATNESRQLLARATHSFSTPLHICMYVCKYSAAPAHARTRAHRWRAMKLLEETPLQAAPLTRGTPLGHVDGER